MGDIFFPLILLGAMYISLVVQHFLPPIPGIGARIFLMPIVMFYGSVALPVWGMLMLTFVGGLMWDLLHVQVSGNDIDIGVGWSIVLYSILGALMSGFRPWFLRGRWEIHCVLCGLCTSLIVLAEYLMISIRRLPVHIEFDKAIWWRIGGAGISAALIAPFIFFALNYLGYLVGYDPNPEPVEEH